MMGTLLKRIFGKSAQTGVSEDNLIDNARFVVFDTELTGLDPKMDSIVSIGALSMQGTRIEVGRPFYQIVEPRTALTGKSIVIHSITPGETEGRPSMETLLPEFLEFCEGAVLVGHLVSMDIGFVNEEMKHAFGRTMENSAVDTINLYRHISHCTGDRCAYYENDREDVNLFSLAKQFGIPVSGAHNALGDAYVTAQLFQRLLSILQGRGVRTVRELLRIGRP